MNKEDDNRITLREIKPNNGAMTEFDFKFDLIQKIKLEEKPRQQGKKPIKILLII